MEKLLLLPPVSLDLLQVLCSPQSWPWLFSGLLVDAIRLP